MSQLSKDDNPHEISALTLKQGQQHADLCLEHGKSVEKVGKILQKQEEALGESIANHGKEIQKHAQESQDYAQAAAQEQGEARNKLHNLSVQAHLKESQQHIQANREYSKILEERLEKSKAIVDENNHLIRLNSANSSQKISSNAEENID